MIELLVVALVVVIGSALCSGSEAALFSVSLIKARQLAEGKSTAGKALLRIKENMKRPIAAIVILNNIFNIVGSIVVGGMAAAVLDSALIGVFSGFLTLSVIIFAEIIPKTLGERYAESISLAIAQPIAWLTRVMLPLVWLVERLVSPIVKGQVRQTTNEAEIALLAQIGQKEGSIAREEALLIQRAFRLNDATAGSLMTPRVSVTYLHGEQTLEEVRDTVIASQHSRILVIGEGIDDVLGVVLRSELLIAIIEGRTNQHIEQMATKVRFVPQSVKADHLLDVFRATRRHLAVVVDEFGGFAGVVTLEDVLEVLTGEIVDETDLVVDMQDWARQRRQDLLADRQGE
jgi:CBS domain containing-hemolysin-like protein